jgi:hypothetical protein
MLIEVVGRDYTELAGYGVPPAGQPEFFPMCWFDTLTFTQGAGGSGPGNLNFFQNVSGAAGADPTLTNMQAAGQMPAGEYFWQQYLTADVLEGPSDSAVAGSILGPIDDIQRLILVTHPTISYRMKNKSYGPYPFSACHGTGGAVGFGWGTDAATHVNQHALNGVIDGGLPTKGFPIIPPNTPFGWSTFHSAAVTLTVSPNIRLAMWGCHYRPVA